MATCSFYGTAERFKTFDYSENSTGLSDARLIIRSDEKNINSLEDFAKSGKKLAPIPTYDARYTLINQYNEKVVPEGLRILDHGRPWLDDQFVSMRLLSSRGMSG